MVLIGLGDEGLTDECEVDERHQDLTIVHQTGETHAAARLALDG
jgi:hypothetical protein